MPTRAVQRAVIWAGARLGARLLPFADAATETLPLARLLRLGLFQVTVGMALTLLAGTLNRVMIVELGVSASLVAVVLGLPLLVAPMRALVGFRSDHHQSVLGWRRVPFIWFGTLMQFGGLAIMPFALILLSGDTSGPAWVAQGAAALAFLLVGAGAHTVQTAGLALATDLAPESTRPRVVALLYLMLLWGTVASALLLGWALRDFSQVRLIQVVQGTAMVTLLLNGVALWRQEARVRRPPGWAPAPRPLFHEAWRTFVAGGRAVRLLVAVALGTFALSMQDVLLEPYGAVVMGMSVGQTTALTALIAIGAIAAFALAAAALTSGSDPIRLGAVGLLVGALAFVAVIFAAPLGSAPLFRAGCVGIGFADGLFSVCTLTAAMGLEDSAEHGLALGAWGAVYATSEGLALAGSGLLRDGVAHLAARGALGEAMRAPSAPYSVVYHVEILLLFAALVALGPLVAAMRRARRAGAFGLADLPA